MMRVRCSQRSAWLTYPNESAPPAVNVPNCMPSSAVASASAAASCLPLGKGAVPSHAHGCDVRLGDLSVLDCDQFGNDADGDFLGRNGADVEADRRMDGFECIRRDALFE